MHGDHLGNTHNKAPNSGTCAAPDVSVSASNGVDPDYIGGEMGKEWAMASAPGRQKPRM